jgi:predicted HAD superfamily Cof-like phosphohydrolase
MSYNWVEDVNAMQTKFGVSKRVHELSSEELREFINFRYRFLQEEMSELESSIQNKDSDLFVDSMIDLCVVALDTMQALGVDSNLAWDRVHKANMDKIPGIKPNRPNPLKLPDLIKPEGWTGPEHHDNIGLLEKAF